MKKSACPRIINSQVIFHRSMRNIKCYFVSSGIAVKLSLQFSIMFFSKYTVDSAEYFLVCQGELSTTLENCLKNLGFVPLTVTI